VRTPVRRDVRQHDRLHNHDEQRRRRRDGEGETPADEVAEELSRRQPHHRPARDTGRDDGDGASSVSPRTRMTERRLKRPEPRKNGGADTAALNPGTSTISPARPSETCTPSAIRGSSPTGSVSVMTMTNAPSATAPADAQPRPPPGCAAVAAARAVAGRVGTAAVHDDAVTTRTCGVRCVGVASALSIKCSPRSSRSTGLCSVSAPGCSCASHVARAGSSSRRDPAP
jgi:hypothetical protein